MKLFNRWPTQSYVVAVIVLVSFTALITFKSCDLYESETQQEEITDQELPPPPPLPPVESEVYDVVEDEPQPIGGLETIYKNLTYPQTARKAGIEGVVVVQFIVDQEGQVRDPEVIRDIGGGTGEAAKQALESTEWKPGKLDGEKVPVRFKVPIRFQLAGSDGDTAEEKKVEDISEHDVLKINEIVVTGYGS